MDRVSIANECIYSRSLVKSMGPLCKLDLLKAMTKWIKDFCPACCGEWGLAQSRGSRFKSVSLAKFSIMINGSPMYCPAHRGLRQDDPLSSFLFSIVGEALSRMIITTRKSNLISRFIPTSNEPTITHFQFADDTIILCVAEGRSS